MESNESQGPAPKPDLLSELSPELQTLVQSLQAKFPDALLGLEWSYKMLSLHIAKNHVVPVFEFLFHGPLALQFLTDLCGVHFPDHSPPELQVVYHLHSLTKNIRLRIKASSPATDPHFPSLTPVFSSANWMERETYDFFGIQFTGHPDLRRILNEDNMNYFPLRKEYPLEDETRTDKNDSMFGR